MATSKDLLARSCVFATGTGTAGNQGAYVYIGDMDPTSVAVSVQGTFSATVQMQASLDGVNGFSVGPTFASTAGSFNMTTTGTAPSACALWMRVTCTAFTSNTSALVVVAGKPAAL